MRKYLLTTISVVCLFIMAGCADVEVPKASEIIKNPLSPGAIRIGMTKEQVVEIYGDPDIKGTAISSKWNKSREEWIYRADHSLFSVGAGYLTEDLYLYFDGRNLTNISGNPLGKETEGAEK